ncbi:MAG: hypothetical protein H6Q91_3086 [Deltaproteobacteria bacterium]|nr:hypothetical protein [Deltaproteobacteria bacterium]
MSEARWPLSPRAARVFYGVADAWLPSGADVDVVAALAPQLRNAGGRLRLELMLWLLEWSPRLLLRSLRGLSWMERRARAAWLERLEHSRVRPVGRSLASLRTLALAAHAAAASGSGAPQSLPGA